MIEFIEVTRIFRRVKKSFFLLIVEAIFDPCDKISPLTP